jgi:hypothetical protein
MSVELAYEGDALIRLYNLLEDISTPALVTLGNAVMCFPFVTLALQTNSFQGWTQILLKTSV